VIPAQETAGESAMMGRQHRDQGQLFYEITKRKFSVKA
jgi:hypothetical protein